MKHSQRSIPVAAALLVACLMSPPAARAVEPAVQDEVKTVARSAAPAPAAPAAQVAPMTAEQLLARMRNQPEIMFVLDVRTPEEYAAGHVPGAVNVPHDQVAARLAEIPKDKDVVLYCRSGRRAGLAADVLAANGYARLSHLEGDMTAWLEQGRPVEK